MSNLVVFQAKARNEPAPGFYTAKEAARLARVPRQRLDAWHREGIVSPTIRALDEDGNEEQGYTFEAVVYVRLIRMLRDRNIPLHKAVEGIRSLREQHGPPSKIWGDVRLLFQGGQVFAAKEKELTTITKSDRAARNQRAWGEILFGDDFRHMRERADALLVPERFRPFVEVDPGARTGAPIIKGTSIRTALILKLDQSGYSSKRIQDSYPHLTLQQIRGAIRFERFLDAEAA